MRNRNNYPDKTLKCSIRNEYDVSKWNNKAVSKVLQNTSLKSVTEAYFLSYKSLTLNEVTSMKSVLTNYVIKRLG